MSTDAHTSHHAYWLAEHPTYSRTHTPCGRRDWLCSHHQLEDGDPDTWLCHAECHALHKPNINYRQKILTFSKVTVASYTQRGLTLSSTKRMRSSTHVCLHI